MDNVTPSQKRKDFLYSLSVNDLFDFSVLWHRLCLRYCYKIRLVQNSTHEVLFGENIANDLDSVIDILPLAILMRVLWSAFACGLSSTWLELFHCC